jgi:bifunctional DNA-binding transcriptional regulator/antitoxin component of YhaV-PrlF toxin-antitoxin module
MKLLLVADGPRDEASLPPLLNVILGRTVECEFESWVRIHRRGSGRGYDRKLRFSVGQARSRGHAGLVAVVDRDKDHAGHRAGELRSTRETDRQTGAHFPTALGVADPHVDVWLLDDPVAVREGLGLEPKAEVISVHRTKDPKAELDRLIHNSGLELIETLKAIATRLQQRRCNHAKSTGFESFAEDCRQEFANFSP